MESKQIDTEILKTKEAAKVLGVSKNTLLNEVRKGGSPAKRRSPRGQYYYDKDKLLAWWMKISA